GMQVSLKSDDYSRPLNTNFYQLKPLVMPRSWSNGGAGGCDVADRDAATVLLRCYSGARTIAPGDVLRYDFRLLITPFKMVDTRAHFSQRYFHAFAPVDTVAKVGANVINVHHRTPINPYLNYPFLRPAAMKAYIDEAHRRAMQVKIYYTVRELTDHAPEMFALQSLGHEIFSSGSGGGASWLQEHFPTQDYTAGWYVPEIKDATVVTNGESRWHNAYIEGLDWLARNVGIDGIYLDDVAFDRGIMQRVRKVLERRRHRPLIDLHSATQFNPADGFASSANLYLEYFPYIDRLWFGEGFDYIKTTPDYWLVEISGIPFGLMGEMLEGGGNPWRGMVYGMTNRVYNDDPAYHGDPRHLWKVWDEFGITGSTMSGYWNPRAPVTTGRADVLATTFERPGRTMVAIGSWSADTARVQLRVNWRALGIDSASATIVAPAIRDFQSAATFKPGNAITIAPGKGALLIVSAR
ncbi:MAG: glycoside hydrolase domain-containing protein, partial [Gemmatimonadaceae bacterium]